MREVRREHGKRITGGTYTQLRPRSLQFEHGGCTPEASVGKSLRSHLTLRYERQIGSDYYGNAADLRMRHAPQAEEG